MVTFIDEKVIERETPAFRQDLALLNRYTKEAGITLEFDADRALQRDAAGADHRYEIVTALMSAKKFEIPSRDKIDDTKILRFIRYVATMADISLRQDHGLARVTAANAPEAFDDVKILGDAQSALEAAGSSLRIDYDLATGKGPEAGAYRVTIADAMEALMFPGSPPTPEAEVRDHPAYEDTDELLAIARRATSIDFSQGNKLI